MGGKRGNENSQMRREDYEAAERDEEEAEVGEGIQRASGEVLQQRRIVRAKRTVTNESNTASAGMGAFAGINLTAGTSGSGFTFGTNNASAASGGRIEKEYEQSLFENYEELLSSDDVHRKEYLIHKMMRNLGKVQKRIFEAERPTAAPVAAAAPNAVAASAPVASNNTASTFASTSTGPAASTDAFAFGAANTSASTSAPPAAPSGSFTFGAASSPVASGALASSAATGPSIASGSAPQEGEPSDEVPANQGGAVVLEVADPDWDDIGSFEPVTIYCREDGWKALLQKTRLRLQRSKTDSSRHRMIARSVMGKPVVNMSIPSGTKFDFSEKSTAKQGQQGRIANILFAGINDSAKRPQSFLIKARFEEGQCLHQKLNELV